MQTIAGIQNTTGPQPLSIVIECVSCRKRLSIKDRDTYLDSDTNGAGIFCPRCDRKLTFHKLPEDRQELVLQEQIPELFWDARLEHLSETLQKEITTLQPGQGMFLYGSPGIGKSYAMAAMMREFIREGFTVQRADYDMLLLMIRDTFKPTATLTELQVILPYIQADKLIIEDVGTTVRGRDEETAFSLRTFLIILDQRILNCKATFITSNKSVADIAKSFDDRVASRLSTFKNFRFEGKDKRIDRSKKL